LFYKEIILEVEVYVDLVLEYFLKELVRWRFEDLMGYSIGFGKKNLRPVKVLINYLVLDFVVVNITYYLIKFAYYLHYWY
jgi:hypothetical protein